MFGVILIEGDTSKFGPSSILSDDVALLEDITQVMSMVFIDKLDAEVIN